MHSIIRLSLPIAALSVLLVASGCNRTDAAAGEVIDGDLPEMTVYKSPTCGCCVVWAEYMEAEGFTVHQVDVPNLNEIRAEMGVPVTLGACHTAVIGDFVVEGHVPAGDVIRLLREAPDARGIAVPGMPIGSPGMEVPGRAPQAYETYLFTAEGTASVFARH
jgi:hypothetical protein